MKAVNLLPSDQRGAAPKSPAPAASPSQPAAGGAGPYVVIGVLAVAIVMLAGYVLTTNTIKDRKADIAKVSADQAAAAAQVAALKPYADFQILAATRVATVQGLATARFDWEQALRDLSRALPSNVHLTALTGKLAGEAAAQPGATTTVPAAPTISLQGCTRTHSDVARLMSHLRIVRGVTGVSLKSSDKADTGNGTAAPAATADGGTPAKQCPGGRPPSFDLVVTFAGAAGTVPVAAGAAAPPAAGTTGAAPAATPTPAPGTAPAATATPAPGAPSASTGATSPVSATQGATP